MEPWVSTCPWTLGVPPHGWGLVVLSLASPQPAGGSQGCICGRVCLGRELRWSVSSRSCPGDRLPDAHTCVLGDAWSRGAGPLEADSPFHPININDTSHLGEREEVQVQGSDAAVKDLEPVVSRPQREAGGPALDPAPMFRRLPLSTPPSMSPCTYGAGGRARMEWPPWAVWDGVPSLTLSSPVTILEALSQSCGVRALEPSWTSGRVDRG